MKYKNKNNIYSSSFPKSVAFKKSGIIEIALAETIG